MKNGAVSWNIEKIVSKGSHNYLGRLLNSNEVTNFREEQLTWRVLYRGTS